ncbi:acyloxyacyl hydrolase [Algoriphagus sediminis]|uniref:Acyloxyacyl hydrolase n=1 Tax=Algoriphagus sediminis TaxID=3057113 RepID=A0ABT7Y950_9BACT|nr:acyloxyacyl hydrolase [Algoriphagus sediminis]MDN3202991.1 acyloxyacyl hydrolase [Algoriphagus sediminis]
MWKRIVGIVFFGCLTANLLAQESSHRFGLEAQYGTILAHNPELVEIADTNPWSISLSSQWMGSSRKNWEACNCFHYLGLNLSVMDFQNPDELGQAWSLSGTFEPYLVRREKLSLSLSTGLGASYITRVYDEVENPGNTFFSSHLSFLIFLSPRITWDFSENWALQGSFTYGHISNGGQKQPNRGMNFPTWGLGILHYTNRADLPEYVRTPIPRKWNFYLDAGFNTRDNGTGGREPNLFLGGGTYRQISGIIGLGGGVELAKDFSIPVEGSRTEALIPAVYAENHFLFGRFDFSQRMALYLHKPKGYQEDHSFYQRYSLHYVLFDSFRIGAGLKAHGHVAEYLDLRLGWVF